ncbi:MAG TPA: prolyl oligopeptidase family serine peptidase [Burkholderiaceae bacterium]
MTANTLFRTLLASSLALGLAACGGGSGGGSVATGPVPAVPVPVPTPVDPTARGTLVQAARLLSLGATAVDTQLADNLAPSIGRTLARVVIPSGTVRCGVDVHEIEYNTVGAQNEKTNATAAVMVPTGGADCTGKRPMMLYAHGTTTDRNYNLANFANPAGSTATESAVAALYAASGYIVVAPNYAGYHKSKLAYHAFHLAEQQSRDMIDALAAARKALPQLATASEDNGKLFITGYSQGGYVALATLRAMQAAGMPVTATAASSGAYAMSAQIDAAYSTTPIFGGAVFGPMIETSWQKAYGNLYGLPTDIYNIPYANTVEALLPNTVSVSELIATGKLPRYQFGTDAPQYGKVADLYKQLFGAPSQSLLKSSYLATLQADLAARPCGADPAAPLNCNPANTLRQAAVKNDLRTFDPTSPLLLCGAASDPVVSFNNTKLAYAYFTSRGAPRAPVTALDVDADGPSGDPYALARNVYTALKQAIVIDAVLNGKDKEVAVLEQVHAPLAALACSKATYDFFKAY